MSNVRRLLELSFFTVLFCGAITFLFFANRSIVRMQAEIKKELNNEVAYEQYKELSEIAVTKGEILAYLFTEELEYDIEIEDVLIRKSEFSNLSIQDFWIEDAVYRKEYNYDNKGNIWKISFERQ